MYPFAVKRGLFAHQVRDGSGEAACPPRRILSSVVWVAEYRTMTIVTAR